MRLALVALLVFSVAAHAQKIQGGTGTSAPASQTTPGIVTTGSQDFAGAKTFYSNVTCSGCSLLAGNEVASDTFRSNSSTTMTIRTSVPATAGTDVGLTINNSSTLTENATDKLVQLQNNGSTRYEFYANGRFWILGSANNAQPGFVITTPNGTGMIFRSAGGSGEIVELSALTGDTTRWDIGPSPGANVVMNIGPEYGATTSMQIYKGTSEGIQMNKGVRFARIALPTCNATNEGMIVDDVLAGASTGNATRLCACRSNGAGTPTYFWDNIITGTDGTTTTCAN